MRRHGRVTFGQFGEGGGHGRGGAGFEAQDAEGVQEGPLAGGAPADPGVGGQGAQGHPLRGLQAPLDFLVGDEMLPWRRGRGLA